VNIWYCCSHFSHDDPGLNVPAELLSELRDELIAPMFGSLDELDGREMNEFSEAGAGNGGFGGGEVLKGVWD
jgi:hypothetical protein